MYGTTKLNGTVLHSSKEASLKHVVVEGASLLLGRHNYPDGLSTRRFIVPFSRLGEAIGTDDLALQAGVIAGQDIGRYSIAQLDTRRMKLRDGTFASMLTCIRVDPQSSERAYPGLRGLGSLLLDSYCSDLDCASQHSYLKAQPLGPGLSKLQLTRWYKSRGYVDSITCSPRTRVGLYNMQRSPGAAGP